MSSEKPLPPKHKSARESVPEGLQEVFDDLVEDYRYYALTLHVSRMISYAIIAELVKLGWRYSGEKRDWRKGEVHG